jgi:Protein of unknown function (DUF1553)/Protein of unknown function (DUF1549)/Concanavalin A-like lectin/glucanases superfamily
MASSPTTRGIVQLICLVATELVISVPAVVVSAEPTEPISAVLNLNFEEQPSAAQLIGEAKIVNDGPTAELFFGMPEKNQALTLTRAGDHLRIPDDRTDGALDFTNGDAITLEAWVKLERIGNGENVYIVGKGRTYEQQTIENQNYALRLTGGSQEAKVSFLFATQDPNDSTKSTYHRWTSTRGFATDNVWHHVAISYKFGEPASIAGYVDGESTKGKWDMGGETKSPPIHDDDSVWIGSARGGDPGNSLLGAVDDVRIFRSVVSANELKSRRKVVPRVPVWPVTAAADRVTFSFHQNAGSHAAFPMVAPKETFRLALPKLALHRLPLQYELGGTRKAWKGPVLLRAFTRVQLPAGEVELLLRSPGLSRVWLNGAVVLSTPARRLSPDAHQPWIVYKPDMPWLRVPRVGDNEARQRVTIVEEEVELILESLIGSSTTRCEMGETLVAYRTGDQMFSLIGPSSESVQLVDQEFEAYRNAIEGDLARLDRQLLNETSAVEDAFWERRHQIAQQHESNLPPLTIPSAVAQLPESNLIDRYVNASLAALAEEIKHQPWFKRVSDTEFLRRVSLDLRGVPPTVDEVLEFESSMVTDKRLEAVERLIADDRWADHWTSYWQDVLAENPNILKPSLNNSGPFRFWLHDALLMNKPMDRFVTELVRMEGDSHAGAAAGFEMAAENDVPMAEKAHILGSAFLAVDMKCARCHDAPYHPWKQKELFEIAAMLKRTTIEVPPTSSVPKEFFDRKGRESPITLTLQPDDKIVPAWPFTEFGEGRVAAELLGRADSTREQLAALLTRAENQRFSQVIVNRVWTRLMGWGLVNSVDDWNDLSPRNPALLDYLSREFVKAGYDLKQLVKLILASEAYQRKSIDGSNLEPSLAYAAPWHRRLTAEQVVDSAHAVSGVPLSTEAITFDPEGSQTTQNFLNLGPAQRAWQLTSLSNERDRPSLALPKAAAVVECMEAFGWRSSRQSPTSHRETEPNVVQPGVVANGSLAGWVTRFTDDSAFTAEALQARSLAQFVDRLFLQILSRHPCEEESRRFVEALQVGFEDRLREPEKSERLPPMHRGFVTWSNHFTVESNALMRDVEREIAAGPEPTNRLSDSWRSLAEDAAWALLNAPEFQFVP